MNEPEYFIGPTDAPDRYRIGLPVGAGAEGVLYHGSIEVGGTTSLDVAIKMLHPNHRARLQQWNERWAAQIELLRSLQAPGVVPVRDGFAGPLPHLAGQSNTDSATLYLVMNWIDGEPLDEWSARHPDIPAEERLKLLLSVAGALDLMHSGQATGGTPVIHGDVKPSNILVRPNGDAVLVDFGLVRLLPEGRVSTGVTGTPGYVAPEVREEGVYTPATDRYALGAVAYLLLTGQEHEQGGSRDLAWSVMLSRYATQPALIDHVMAMLDRDPDRRPRVLANWCAQLRQSSLDPMYQPDRLPPIAPIRVATPGRITISPDDESGKITILELDSEVPQKGSQDIGVPIKANTGQATIPDPPVAAPAPTPATPAHTSRRLVLLSAALAAVLIAAAAGVLALRSEGSTPGRQTYSFTPAVLGSGLVVARTWTVAGSSPVLTENLVLTNGTNHELTTTYDEVIPNTVASNVDKITFNPRPSEIVTTDPLVRYDLSLAAGTSRTVRYSVRLPGSGPVSLSALVESMQGAQGGYDSKTVSATLTSLSISPTALHITVGDKRTVTVNGVMSNGAKASPAVLKAARWTSTDSGVATVSHGMVAALDAGTTAITIRCGHLIAVLSVLVVGTSNGPNSSSQTSPSGSSGSSSGSATHSSTGSAGGAGSSADGTSAGGVVSNLTVSPDGSGQISVAWQCNPVGSACSGGQTVQSFAVTVTPSPPALPTPPLPAAGKTAYSESIGGLSNGTSYTVAVSACDAGGCTPSGEIPSETVNPYGAPGSPSLSGSANGTTITWNWSPPTQTGGRPITAYQVTLDGSVIGTSSATSYNETFGYSQSHTLSVVAVNSESMQGPAASYPVQIGAAPQSGQPTTYAETAGGVTHTWTDYEDAGGTEGPSIQGSQTVQIACKVTGFRVADGNTWWYRIASSPWNGTYYASADAFYNDGSTSGSLQGTPFVDPAVPNC